MLPTYVGIAGAVNGLVPGYNDGRVNRGGTSQGCCGSGGIISGGGTLFPYSQVRLVEMTDGTSNTMMISEQGDYLTTANGTRVAWNAAGPHGWMIGVGGGNAPPSYNPNSDARAFNVTTIRYAINQKRGWPDGGHCGNTGVCENTGQNTPLNSAHSGGVIIGMGDGSNRFLSDSTSVSILALLAIRDDGQVIPNF
jgi:hypothetical protein